MAADSRNANPSFYSSIRRRVLNGMIDELRRELLVIDERIAELTRLCDGRKVQRVVEIRPYIVPAERGKSVRGSFRL